MENSDRKERYVFEDEETEEIYINADDGMPNSHPNTQGMDDDWDESDQLEDLPKSVIVTNIHSEVFFDDKLKADMEDLFRSFSPAATFQWLRSFRRLRVNFDNSAAAANARIHLHQFQFDKSCISCYFAQPVTPVSATNLKPPAPVKQFLISPPSSPPVGWEPREENEPLLNHDLLAALANLSPGECHELHASTPDQPAIVVHTALQPGPALVSGPIPHTRCPETSTAN